MVEKSIGWRGQLYWLSVRQDEAKGGGWGSIVSESYIAEQNHETYMSHEMLSNGNQKCMDLIMI